MTRTVEEFLTRFKGKKTHHVAKAVTRLTPGVIYTGCSKRNIADGWANRDYGVAKVTLEQIEESLEKVEREMDRRPCPSPPNGQTCGICGGQYVCLQSWRKKS